MSQNSQGVPSRISPAKRGKKRKISIGTILLGGGSGAGGLSPSAAYGTAPLGSDGEGEGVSKNTAPIPMPGIAGAKKKAKVDPAAAGLNAAPIPKVYGYETEIAQMIYVFGEISDPPLGTLHLMEDIVRSQVIELLTRARHTSFHRLSSLSSTSSSSASSSNAANSLTYATTSTSLQIEDLIFLIRDDRVKVNRLRTYLSWKEVRKNAKKDGDTTGVGGPGGGEGGGGGGGDEEADGAAKAIKNQVVKLPWELLTPFTHLLRNLPYKSGSGGATQQDEDDEDDDELEAYEDNIQRLREHDVATRRMTKEQYVFYSECRQASFTFRKAKRFREFVNAAAYLDVKVNDDIADVLGFLCFEMVRTICIAALASRNRSMGIVKRAEVPDKISGDGAAGDLPKDDEAGAGESDAEGEGEANGEDNAQESPKEGKEDGDEDILEELKEEEEEEDAPKRKKRKPPGRANKGGKGSSGILNAPPNIPCDPYTLMPSHVMTAFTRMQRDQATKKNGGMRGWRGGPMRMQIGLI